MIALWDDDHNFRQRPWFATVRVDKLVTSKEKCFWKPRCFDKWNVFENWIWNNYWHEYCIERTIVSVSKESSVCYPAGGKVKQQNLASNKLIWVKYPPWQDSKDDVSSVSPLLLLLLNRKNAAVCVGHVLYDIFWIQFCCLISLLATLTLI